MRAAALIVLASCAVSARDTTPPPPDAGQPDDDASGGGGVPDGAPAACTPQPIGGLTPEQWYWVPVSGSACGNGSSAGFAINTTTKSKEVVIFLMGGGGCYSAETCSGPQPTAANLNGYTASTAAQELGMFQAGSIFDRNAASNPLRDATFVFVPYCTGDFHSGNTVAAYGTHHVGYANISAYLAMLAPAYCDASRIVLTGSSAGGFGTLFNYEHVQEAFPQTPIDLVDDSGPPLRQVVTQQNQLRAAWGQVANLPADCIGCDQAWHNFLPYLTAKHPAQRFSLISSLQDYSIGTFFGFTPSTYQAAINDLADNVIAPLANLRVYYIANNDHVWLNRNLASISTSGTTLATFLQNELDHTSPFTNIRPP
ncbi:MAG TPA: pectin acetylesterase-family hydrolase [Kofleriaceae bacterium]|nr:pectin acetylesterase-family hydrolase [Kofleriaceae bacterium]